ncbi:MAG: hypothetical protein WCK63_06510 [Betaproteobacteria bacterium]
MTAKTLITEVNASLMLMDSFLIDSSIDSNQTRKKMQLLVIRLANPMLQEEFWGRKQCRSDWPKTNQGPKRLAAIQKKGVHFRPQVQ